MILFLQGLKMMNWQIEKKAKKNFKMYTYISPKPSGLHQENIKIFKFQNNEALLSFV